MLLKINNSKLEELKAADARRTRNALLASTDWTMLPDVKTDKAAWGEYRQKLRDITKQNTFPLNINWPEKPAV